MRRKRIAILLLLLAVGGGLWLLATRRPPADGGAKLSGSTPATQNGFTFLAVRPIAVSGQCTYEVRAPASWLDRLLARFRGGALPTGQVTAYADFRHAGGLGIWLRKPARTAAGALVATAHFPDGTSLSVTPQIQSVGGDTLYLYSVPGGYPDAFKYFDLSLKDGAGRTSRWRVTDLPPSHHAVAGPAAARQKFSGTNLEVASLAWWLPSPGPGSFERSLRYDLEATGKPSGPYHWEIAEKGVQGEWQPPVDSATHGTSTSQWTGPQAQFGSQTNLFYASHHHAVKVEGSITEYEVLDETVTFRNLPVTTQGNIHYVSLAKAQTAKTASGVVVTLPAQNADPTQPTPMVGGPGWLGLQVDLPPDAEPASLPGSSLARKVRSRIKLEINNAKPFPLRSWSGAAARREIGLEIQGAVPTRIPALTLVIRQRVDRRNLPFALTVPIEEKEPARR